MTYAAAEASADGGEPFFLYLLNNGVTKTRLTSEDDHVFADPEATGSDQKWYKSPIKHSDIEQTGNIERNSVDLTFPLSDAYARSMLKPQNAITTVTVWRGHRTDPDNEFRVVWKGRFVKSTATKETIKLSIESAFTSLRRPGCRARYQRTCRHTVYFPGCFLNIDDKKIPASLTGMTGDLVLTVPEAALSADGEYKAGLVIFNGLYGWVGSHVGSTLTLIGVVDGMAEAFATGGALAIEIAPGCDLSETRCAQLGNHLNMGGFKNLPDRNPFDQGIA